MIESSNKRMNSVTCFSRSEATKSVSQIPFRGAVDTFFYSLLSLADLTYQIVIKGPAIKFKIVSQASNFLTTVQQRFATCHNVIQ